MRCIKLLGAVPLALLLAGCGDQSAVTPPDRSSLTPRASGHDDYPTPAELSAAGVGASGITAYSTAVFSSPNWVATGHIAYEWANVVTAQENASVIRNSTAAVINSDHASLDYHRFNVPSAAGDTTLKVTLSTLNRTCGITGKHSVSGTAAIYVTVTGAPTLWDSRSITNQGADVTQDACASPKAALNLSYGSMSGSELDLNLPNGTNPDVGLSSAGSAKGEAGGPEISSYNWVIGTSSASSSSSFTSTFYNSESVGLMVTDQDGVSSNWSYGTVNVNHFDPCDNIFTEEVETSCDWMEAGDEISCGGSQTEDGVPHGGGGGSGWTCLVTDWYEWNGHGWTYRDTTIDYCYLS